MNNATRAERTELAGRAVVQIQGLADALTEIVRSKTVDSFASQHTAALGILASIRSLSDEAYDLVHGDDEIDSQQFDATARRFGIDPDEYRAYAKGAEHG